MMGFYERGSQRIVVRLAAQLQMTKTLAHELGHHFAGHGSPRTNPRGPSKRPSPERRLRRPGPPWPGLGARSFPYIATWSRDRKLLQQAMGTIQKISATIIDGVEQQEAEPMPRQSGEPAPRRSTHTEVWNATDHHYNPTSCRRSWRTS